MARSPKTLDRLPLVDEDSGDLTVVVETPKGSRNKYKYDPEHNVMKLGAILAEGLAFPFDFGFFPSRSTCCLSSMPAYRRVASRPHA